VLSCSTARATPC